MGTVRSFNQALRVEAEGKIEKIVKGITEAHGGSYTYTYRYGYDPVINDEYIAKIVEESALHLFGNERVVKLEPSMGGEDFSAYLRKAPGCFIKLEQVMKIYILVIHIIIRNLTWMNQH